MRRLLRRSRGLGRKISLSLLISSATSSVELSVPEEKSRRLDSKVSSSFAPVDKNESYREYDEL